MTCSQTTGQSLHRQLTRGILLISAFHAVTSLANAAAVPSYLPENGEVIRLDQFEVNGQRDKADYAVARSRTATKTDTALIDVPQAITVITRDLIDDQAMLSLGDVTRYVPGAGIAQGEGNRDTPVLRGNSTTADFFVDGIRDDVQYFRDLYNVDRVEVLKGPNAMIFGRGGSGGVINRVIRQANWAQHRDFSFQAGSWEHYRGVIDFGQPINNALAFRATGMLEDSGSYRESVTLNRRAINPTLAWQLSPQTILRAGFEYFHDERVADRGISSFQGRPVVTAPSTFFGDPAQSSTWAYARTSFVSLEHTFANGSSLRNRLNFGDYDKFYQNVFPGAVDATGNNVSIAAYSNATARRNWINQTDFVIPLGTNALKQTILAGLELGHQETDNFRRTGYFDSISPTTTSITVPVSNPRTSLPVSFRQSATDADNHGIAKTVSIYAQDQIELSPRLQAILGLRLESFDMDFRNHRTGSKVENRDNEISPRVGAVFKPVDLLSLYASYSRTFVPRAGEQLSSLTLANRSLDPERFENIEIGAKWEYRPDLILTAAAYQLDRRNVAIADPSDPTKSILVDGQRAKGIELGITGRLTSDWSIVGGYSYQDGSIKTTQSSTIKAGQRLGQLPRHSFSLWSRYDLNAQWGAGLGIIHRGAIFASADNRVSLPGFVRLDAAVFFKLNSSVRFQLNVENMLDRKYYSLAHSNNNITPSSPLAVRVGTDIRF